MLDTFTTGDVSKICGVAPRTVSKWFDSGDLKGYKIPGSQDRRIPEENLRAFMERAGIPLDAINDYGKVPKVLVVSRDDNLVDALKKNNKLFVASDAYDAGTYMAKPKLNGVVADFSTQNIPAEELFAICVSVREKFEKAAAVAIFSEQGFLLNREVFHDVFRRSLDPNLVAARLGTLMTNLHKRKRGPNRNSLNGNGAH